MPTIKTRQEEPKIEAPAWTAEEDDAITEAVNMFGTNWDLVADVITSLPRTPRVRRTKKQCVERWKLIGPTDDKKEQKPKPKLDTPIQYHFAVLDVIKRSAQKKKGGAAPIAPTAAIKPPEKQPETAPTPVHASHTAAATAALAASQKPLRSPLDVMAFKASTATSAIKSPETLVTDPS